MNCEHKRQNLLDLAYGELSPQHTEQVADTVHNCAACRTELERIENVRGAFRDAMPLEEVPHLVRANILREARLKAYTEPPSVFERLQKLLFHPGFAAAAAVALVLVISGILFQPTLLNSPADHAEMAAAPSAADDSFAEKAAVGQPLSPDEAAPASPVAAPPAAAAPVGELARVDPPTPKVVEKEVPATPGELALAEGARNEDEAGAGADAENVWKLDGKPVAKLDQGIKEKRSNVSMDDLLGGRGGKAKPATRAAKTNLPKEPSANEPVADAAPAKELDKKLEAKADPAVQAAVVPADMANMANAEGEADADDAAEEIASADQKLLDEKTVKQGAWSPGYRPGNAASRAKAGSNSAVGFGDGAPSGADSLAPGSGSAYGDNVYGQGQAVVPNQLDGEGAKYDENVARKRFERGLSRYQRGDYGNAVTDFDSFMNDAPRSSNYYALAMYYKGRSLLNRGNGAGAVKAFRSVIGEYPASEKRDDARYWLAKALLRSDPQNAEAQQILSELMSGKSAVAGNARDTYDRSFGKASGKKAPGSTAPKKARKAAPANKKKSKGKSMDYYESPDEKQMEAVE